MVTALTSNTDQRCSQKPLRPPYLRPHPDHAPTRRPKAREISSRYLSLSTSSSSSNSSFSTNTTSSSSSSNSSFSTNTTSSSSGSSISSRLCQSAALGLREANISPMSSVKERAVSAERRRTPPPPAVDTKTSIAERMLTTSIRSLSVSFQGDSFSMRVNKVKPPPMLAGTPGGLWNGTPDRRKSGMTPVRDRTARDRENSRPSDQQHRWPGRLRGENSSFLSRSLDCGADRGKLNGSERELKELRKCMDHENSGNKGVKLGLKNFGVKGIGDLDSRLDLVTDSVSLQSTTRGNAIQLRGRVVPSRIGQELNNRGVQILDPASPVFSNTPSRTGPSKLVVTKKFPNDSHVPSPSEVILRKGLSPLRPGSRLASPSKALTPTSALFRGMTSPIRTRDGVGNLIKDNNMCSTPSMLSFAADVMRGKFGKNQILDAHDLRLLHNRLLQWRLANAKTEKALLVQKQAAERSLYNAWVSTSKLRHSVESKRTELQSLRHNLKLYSILEEQELHLENWDLINRDYCNSLPGIIKAFEANTIRLPVVSGARADVQNVQEAISSAVDAMQAVTSSICSLLTKVEQTDLLMAELSDLSVRERGLLDEIKDFLSTTFIPLQVVYCSLRTHELQLPVTLPQKM